MRPRIAAILRLALAWTAVSLASFSAAAANSSPQFDATTNRHVINGGVTITITNTATDADLPVQSLSYGLLSGPPGAGIDPANGVVTWATTTNNAGSSNFFRVVVADSGTPPLSATNSFTVFVRPSKPNIVIIVTDDHGFGDISAHGCPAPTPNMDRLGSEGIRLERFYATPVCSVTRSTLLTGRNPIRTQVNNGRGLDLGEHTLPQTFKAAGYQTFMCGKWHLGGLYNTETNTVINGITVPVIRENVEYQPQNRGWEVHYGEYTGAINYQTHVSQENGQPDWWLNGQPSLDAGWSTDLLADKAVQLLQQRDPSKPVVLYLAFNAVHGPVSAPTAYLNKYLNIPTVNRRTTLAAIDQMDVAIGRVLNAIDVEGITSSTLVAFFGDNGGQASTGGSNLPLRGDKGSLFDGGIHTPAAIRWPGVLPSGITNCQQFVWVGDLFPTLCAAAGVTPMNAKPFDGVNLWPRLLAATNGPFNPSSHRGAPIVSGSSAGSGVFDVFSNGVAPTMFKLIRDRLGGGGGFTNLGLFDIISDPFETNDLSTIPAHATIVSTLSAYHDAIKAESYSPYIGVHPQSQSATAGSTVRLWAMTTVYPRTVGCQWRKDGVNLPGATNRMTVDSGVYLTWLDLPGVSAADTAAYDVVVTDNALGWPTTVASLPAQLTVNAGGGGGEVAFDTLLGRPTDTSIAVSVLSSNSAQMYFEYGGQPGIYTNTTPLLAVPAGVPALTTIHQLAPNRRYYYRARHSKTGIGPFSAGPEWTFHTQRARGSTFTFDLEADPHNRDNVPAVWKLALTNMLADGPDFLIDLGDTFFEEKVGTTNAYYLTQPGIYDLHREVRTGYFSIIGHSVPTFLVNGNHEAELGWLLNGVNNPGVWSAQARQHFFPVPIPGGFYSGATNSDPYTLGPRDGYYAFEWGDALFVTLDPFWYTSPKPQQNGWSWTLGAPQYFWLKQTLERSTARFKFVFAHHLVGGLGGADARGGSSFASWFEWGGFNTNGTYGFTTQRPGWPAPIQDLLLANGVQAFFHGHDHLFVKEVLDANRDGLPELIYQEVPQPSQTIFGTNAAASYGYTNAGSVVLASSGHLRVTVSPTNARVDYVRVFLPANEGTGRTNRMIAHSYNIAPAARWSMTRLPDTGQTNRYAAPVPGVDADYAVNVPALTNNGDGTTTDEVTGLTWQRVDGGEMTWPNAQTYAATNTLGAVPPGTWRLPTIHELASIMVYYRENPALNTNHFLSGSGANADYWWSRDRMATDPTRIWCANAGGGVGPKPQSETLSSGGPFRYHARLVRGPFAPTNSPIHRFLDHGLGAISDLDTGLMWQQGEAPAPMDWTNALLYAEGLTLSGFTDWRLPNIKELESLNDETLASPSIDTSYFPAAKPARYWSSTTQNNRATNAWFAEFISGITSQGAKTGSNWVRAVRGPAPLTHPVLALAASGPEAGIRLTVSGDAGRLYTLQASMDLVNWTDLFTITPAVTPFVWTDENPAPPWRFFRATVEP